MDIPTKDELRRAVAACIRAAEESDRAGAAARAAERARDESLEALGGLIARLVKGPCAVWLGGHAVLFDGEAIAGIEPATTIVKIGGDREPGSC